MFLYHFILLDCEDESVLLHLTWVVRFKPPTYKSYRDLVVKLCLWCGGLKGVRPVRDYFFNIYYYFCFVF